MVVIKNSLRMLAGLILVSFMPLVQAESNAVLTEELSQLQADFAGNVVQVKSGIDKLEWTGISDVALFDKTAVRSENLKPDDVRLVIDSNFDLSKCKFIKQETCKSNRGYSKCIVWHKKVAAKNGANTFVILSKEKKFSPFSITGTSGIVMADYYTCTEKDGGSVAQ